MNEAAEPKPPQTLIEADQALARLRPRQQAPLAEWLAYHRQAAAVYAEIAEIDRGHHHEALFMAEHELKRAQEIAAQVSTQRPVGEL
jgi:hypothetical protein